MNSTNREAVHGPEISQDSQTTVNLESSSRTGGRQLEDNILLRHLNQAGNT